MALTSSSIHGLMIVANLMAATPPWLRRVLIEASTLTVSKGFFLTMALHPHVVRKAQEELDRIVGNELLPGPSDWENLPYISVLLKELLRWTVSRAVRSLESSYGR